MNWRNICDKICKKPIAKYDMVTKSAYVEYADGEKEYVNQKTNADDVVASTGMDNFEAAKFVDRKRYEEILN